MHQTRVYLHLGAQEVQIFVVDQQVVQWDEVFVLVDEVIDGQIRYGNTKPENIWTWSRLDVV